MIADVWTVLVALWPLLAVVAALVALTAWINSWIDLSRGIDEVASWPGTWPTCGHVPPYEDNGCWGCPPF